jgi:hypothetical protein
MRNNTTLVGLAGLGLALALLMTPATAETTLVFDPPIKVVEIPPSGIPGTGDAVSCTYYANALVRISGVDTPAPDNALIVPLTAGKPLPNCGRTVLSQGIELQSGASDLVGRKGNFLVFQYVDQVSAGYFTIFDVRTGKALFNDGIFKGFISVALNQGILQLGYNRGINATCSLLSDRTGCWADLLAKGQIPPGAFRGPPSIETCKKGYGSDPVDQRSVDAYVNHSIVSYDAALTLDSKGHAAVRPVGALHCDPES